MSNLNDVGKNLNNFVGFTKDTVSGLTTQVGSLIGKGESTVEIIIYIIIALVVVIFITWAYSITQQQSNECANLSDIYDNKPDKNIRPIGELNPFVETSQQGVNTVSNSNQFSYRATIDYFSTPPVGPGRIFS